MDEGPQNLGQSNILNDLAYSTYLTRKLRLDIFQPSLFGEPAWDILLLLFSNADSSGQLSEQEIARELRLAERTVGRWLAILANCDLVHVDAGRAELSANGRDKLKIYLKRQIGSLTQMLQAISLSDDSRKGAA